MEKKMQLSEAGVRLIKSFEGLRLKAYKDVAGIWTIGYGSTKYADGNSVKKGDILKDEHEASVLFSATLITYERAVINALKIALTQNQFDALVSITYNAGTGIMKSSTLIRKLNAGDIPGAAAQFLVWNKITDPLTAKKTVCSTLVKRRLKEQQLFLKT